MSRHTLSRRAFLSRSASAALVVGAGTLTLQLPGLLGAPAASASALNGVIGRQEVMDRAWDRFHKRPRYSQTIYPGLDGFRQDCSGYVSFAWNTLPNGWNGWTTRNLNTISTRINAVDLRSGDILLGSSHVMVFMNWVDASKTSLQVLEHGGGSSGVEPPEFNTYRGVPSGFAPWRYNRIDELAPYGTIRVKWLNSGAGNSPVGNPVLPELDAKRGGRFQDFQRGMIIWNRANNQAWMVHGLILKAYRDNGSEQSWGFPIQDEAAAGASPRGTAGRFQKFENALILWAAPTGAFILHGEIRKFFEAGGNQGRFGYPTSNEIPEGSGFRQTFELGTIHWTPTGGARWVGA